MSKLVVDGSTWHRIPGADSTGGSMV